MPLEEWPSATSWWFFPTRFARSTARPRRARDDGRVVPHGRALPDVQDAGLGGALRGDQRRLGDHPGRKLAEDSRYAKIMQVMRASEQRRPRLRRLGDQLGAFYTPLAVAIALAAWAVSGTPIRFLAVLVVATPCPLLIAIPVAIIGAISLAARRGIIIKDPAVLETIDTCRTAIFDKTGTLTYGRPRLTEVIPRPGLDADEVLGRRQPGAVLEAPPGGGDPRGRARGGRGPTRGRQIQERPGEGLRGRWPGGRSRSPAARS